LEIADSSAQTLQAPPVGRLPFRVNSR
jgi:hypothetical protein